MTTPARLANQRLPTVTTKNKLIMATLGPNNGNRFDGSQAAISHPIFDQVFQTINSAPGFSGSTSGGAAISSPPLITNENRGQNYFHGCSCSCPANTQNHFSQIAISEKLPLPTNPFINDDLKQVKDNALINVANSFSSAIANRPMTIPS